MADKPIGKTAKKGDGGQPTELPYSTPNEFAEFFDIVRLLDAGQISAETASTRMLVLYDMGLGAWVRVMSRLNPGVAGTVTRALTKDLKQITQNLQSTRPASPGTDDEIEKRETPKMRAKTTDVLKRERAVLEALQRTDGGLTLEDLVDRLKVAGIAVDPLPLTTNLDRLVKGAVIERPSKGHYRKCDRSKAYMAEVIRELDKRA